MSDQIAITRKHIQRVNALLADFAHELVKRGIVHDESKWSDEEMGPLQELQHVIDTEGPAPYGTEEYHKRTKKYLSGMTQHHYERNSHHPQYYGEDGVSGMTLGDLVEMFFDWKAASERGGDSKFNIASAIERYKISPQIAAIFFNTAAAYGWETT